MLEGVTMPANANGHQPTAAQRQVADHDGAPLIVCGAAGSGRTEALALRLGALASRGEPPEVTLLLARSRATRSQLRERVEALLDRPHSELWIHTYEEVAEALLREYSTEAGLDPFFSTVSGADRLAILLDRLDELPLRRHEIRGNAAGLLARLLRRIDLLKAEAVLPTSLREWAVARERAAAGAGERERAEREIEFADLYARHDRVLREAGSLDGGDLVLELTRLLGARADVAESVAGRFRHVIADELEDAGLAHRRLLEALAGGADLVCACDPGQTTRRFRGAGAAALEAFRTAHPDAVEVELGPPLREAREVRFWRCANDRAQAQAVAREVERLLAAGEARAERICVIAGSGWREARLVAAALEERSVRFRFAGDAAFFQRPEVRDALAWLRMLADPGDAAAVVRALTRPPVDLRSVDLAKVTTIARRRKLDMVSALEAALESPQLPPEARDRIQAFLRLYRAAANALEQMRADVFVRRLVERVGLRRHRLFAASPETVERLVNLSRLAELATDWSRREPRGSVRDFVRHLAAVADAGDLGADDCDRPGPGAVLVAEPEQVKGLEFEHVYLLGLREGAISDRRWEDAWIPDELVAEPLPPPGAELSATRRSTLAHVALTRATRALVLSWPERVDEGASAPADIYRSVREARGGEEEHHAEELFGPAEGMHSTYRMLRDEVLEASWRAGGAVSEMRLDTAQDVTSAVARFLELIKLAALIQRPGAEPAPEALAAVNELLGRVASDEQRAALAASALDEYLIGDERERGARREQVAARREPSLEQFLPRRGDGLALSASDIDLYRTCPLKYKFARVFAIPQEPTINQRFGILIHQVLDRFHAEEMRFAGGADAPLAGARPGSLDRLLSLFEAGWRRIGFGASDDELQYRDRAVAALARYEEQHERSDSRPVWLERNFAFAIGPHQLRGRVDRVDALPGGGYELIDYKTGDPGSGPKLSGDVQLALYRLAAREAWRIDADLATYWYVLADQRVPVRAEPDDPERVERTVLEVAAGISEQDFEPRPSHEICSWCDYRLICPASEA
ncbi:MAG: AAA family ATPase [Solirubrobacterales bacterium]|nr:AAA family ATPase [Solirubrobacterales bacterium]